MERFAIKIDKKLKANLYKICRLCGIDNPEMVPILTSDNENQNNEPMDVDAEPEMPQKIKILIGLVVTKDDKMPQTMCSLCVDKINDFYEFREMCYATNVQTRKLLGLKNVKKPAPDVKPKLEIKEEPLPTPKGNLKVLKSVSTAPARGLANSKGFTNSKSLVRGLKLLPPTSATAKLLAKDSRKRKQDEPEEAIARESRKRKQEEQITTLPIVLTKKEPVLPAMSNKKLRLGASALKKPKQKNKDVSKDMEIKEEIKEEPKEEKAQSLAPAVLPSPAAAPSAQLNNKLKQFCSICPERFATKAKLEAHIRLHHVPRVERYVCTACNETIAKSFDIKNHQLWHKLSKTPYVCGLCGESILSTYAYARHVKEHSIETSPAFLVLDRECPQCHVSYETNYLYNTHPCAVKAKRCAGCNRLQRSDAEFIKHSALCAKVYLSYSRHIMPAVEAQEDAVRIKNENDVEAAAEEMARITGMPLDMTPVVQLTRLSSPLIMAATQCVSIPGLEDSPSTSAKKAGKKGMSKKDMKRVDELLKSTLDALVSIKHEPEVHVDTEPPSGVGEQSDTDGPPSENTFNMDVGFQEEDDSEHEESTKATDGNSESNLIQVNIKKELDESHETLKPEDGKSISCGGLKLKIRKEHGQLNSSLIEQQKSDEKRAEKRKKKKKHKDKDKDKPKVQKDLQAELSSVESFNTQHKDLGPESRAAVRIKDEPLEDTIGNDVEQGKQDRPQPEAMIMTSIPMMQLQISCISEGVDFNSSNATTAPFMEEQQITQIPAVENTGAPIAVSTRAIAHDDVKPNRKELDRLMQISNISSGVEMETLEKEPASSEDGHQLNHNNFEEEGSDREDEGCANEYPKGKKADNEQTNMNDNESTIEIPSSVSDFGVNAENQKQITRKIIKQKTPFAKTPVTKSRNKACKSTAKPSFAVPTIPPVLQIASVVSGATLSLPTESAAENDFAPVFIKPEPQNRGYSDENPAAIPATLPISPPLTQNNVDEVTSILHEEQHSLINNEEQSFISSIDFNNITIKQEKDIEIDDVQMTVDATRYCNYPFNGIKKRKVVRHSALKNQSSMKNNKNLNETEVQMGNDNEPDEYDIGSEEGDEEEEEETYTEDEDDELDEDEPEEEEDADLEGYEEEEEEREYRELDYPPLLKTYDNISDEVKVELQISDNGDNNNADMSIAKGNNEIAAETLATVEKGKDDFVQEEIFKGGTLPGFVISNVCSHALASSGPRDFTNSAEIALGCQPIVSDADFRGEAQDNLLTFEDKELNYQHSINRRSIDQLPVLKIACVSSGSIDMQQKSVSQFSNKKENELEAESLDEVVTTKIVDKVHQNYEESNVSLMDVDAHKCNVNSNVALEVSEDSSQSSSTQFYRDLFGNKPLKLDKVLTDKPTRKDEDAQSFILQQKTEKAAELKSEVQTESNKELGGIRTSSEALEVQAEDPNLKVAPVTFQNASTTQLLEKDSFTNDLMEADIVLKKFPREEKLRKVQEKYEQADKELPESQFSIESRHQAPLALSLTTSTPNESHNNDATQGTSKEYSRSETIEGVVVQQKDTTLEAKPFLKYQENDDEIVDDAENDNEEDNNKDEDVDEEEEDEDDSLSIEKETEEKTKNVMNSNANLEEQQNQQNQQQQHQENQLDLTRPTALALHPYLEDISSSSNSFMSNTLSQTPPPHTQSTSSSSLLHTNVPFHYSEESENILNESSDVLSRRPSFNFDNINEIAENNNNANLEREQLQDDQQQRNNVT